MTKSVEGSGLHERMLIAVGDRTYRLVGELTHTHPETVRRYLQGQAPNVDFVTALCDAMDFNPDWLLRGTGPMRSADALSESLKSASPSELMQSIGTALDALCSRLERLETTIEEHQIRNSQPGLNSLSVEAKGLRLAPSDLPTVHGRAIGE